MSGQLDVREAAWWNAVRPPAMHSGSWGLDQPSNGASPAEPVDDLLCFGVHEAQYAIIGSLTQALTCDISDCDNRKAVRNYGMAKNIPLRPETQAIFDRLDRLGLKQRDLAAALNLEENKVSKVRGGERQFKGPEMIRALEWLSDMEAASPTPNAVPVKLDIDAGRPLARDLPIYGTALGGEVTIDGCEVEQIELDTGDVIGWAKRPTPLAGRADVYAVYVQGASMYPRYDGGDLAYGEEKRPPHIGDDVIVYLRNGEDRAGACLIKRLVRRSASYVELEQFNPACTFKIDTARILKMHRVIPYGELLS